MNHAGVRVRGERVPRSDQPDGVLWIRIGGVKADGTLEVLPASRLQTVQKGNQRLPTLLKRPRGLTLANDLVLGPCVTASIGSQVDGARPDRQRAALPTQPEVAETPAVYGVSSAVQCPPPFRAPWPGVDCLSTPACRATKAFDSLRNDSVPPGLASPPRR